MCTDITRQLTEAINKGFERNILTTVVNSVITCPICQTVLREYRPFIQPFRNINLYVYECSDCGFKLESESNFKKDRELIEKMRIEADRYKKSFPGMIHTLEDFCEVNNIDVRILEVMSIPKTRGLYYQEYARIELLKSMSDYELIYVWLHELGHWDSYMQNQDFATHDERELYADEAGYSISQKLGIPINYDYWTELDTSSKYWKCLARHYKNE